MYDRILVSADGSDTATLAVDAPSIWRIATTRSCIALYVAERTRSEPTQKGLEEKVAEELNQGET